jgi:hypothetical protein
MSLRLVDRQLMQPARNQVALREMPLSLFPPFIAIRRLKRHVGAGSYRVAFCGES